MFSVYQRLESRRNSSIFLSSSWTIKTKYPSHFIASFSIGILCWQKKTQKENTENKPEQTILSLRQLTPFIKFENQSRLKNRYMKNKYAAQRRLPIEIESVHRVWTWTIIQEYPILSPKSFWWNYLNKAVRIFCSS